MKDPRVAEPAVVDLTLADEEEEAEPTRRAVAGAALLATAKWQCTLAPGEYVIGRDESCRVQIDDALASRQHARLVLHPEGAKVVDLKSANGLFVNTVRVAGERQLYHGDRLLIGTTEVVVLSADLAELTNLPVEERNTLTGVPPAERNQATVRAGALDVLGRVAERLLAAGQVEKARQLLGEQLVKLLVGARSGLLVPDDVCRLASRHALKLAVALRDGRWVDYTVELHLRSEQALAPNTLTELEVAVNRVPTVEQALFAHYCDWLEKMASTLPGHAARIAQRLRALALPPPHAAED